MRLAVGADVLAQQSATLAVPPVRISKPTSLSARSKSGNFLVAALRARNCVALAGAVVTCLALVAAGHLAPAFMTGVCGVALYSVLVLVDLFDPDLPAQLESKHQPLLGDGDVADDDLEVNLDEPLHVELSADAMIPMELRRLLAGILTSHELVRSRLVAAAPVVREALHDTYRRCTELALIAGRLINRGCRLGAYLSGHRPEGIEGELGMLHAARDETDDSVANAAYKTAIRAKASHLTNYLEVRSLYQRVQGQLNAIKALLESVEVRLVKLEVKAIDAGAAVEDDPARALDELTGALSSELNNFECGIREIAAFEHI